MNLLSDFVALKENVMSLSFFIFLLTCCGMTQIIVFGKIFDSIRPEGNLFHCPMCMGFHVGWVVYLLSFFTVAMNLGEFSLIMLFFYSCISSAVSYVYCNMFDDNGLRIGKNDTKSNN